MTDALTLIRAREALSKVGSYRRAMKFDAGNNNDLRATILDAAMVVLRRDIKDLEEAE